MFPWLFGPMGYHIESVSRLFAGPQQRKHGIGIRLDRVMQMHDCQGPAVAF